MAKKRKSAPSYRHHKQSGQAVVTLTCRVTGKRRDVLLGEYDSADSHARYAETIAQWERDGRVLDNAPDKPAKPDPGGVTVSRVMLDWWEDQLKRYGITDPHGRLPSHLYSNRSVVRLVRATCGRMPATEFGPAALQEVRRAMVDSGWSRGHVNGSVTTVIRAFKRAVSVETVKPESVFALRCVEPLRSGELGTRDGETVKAVPLADVEAVKPYVSRQIEAIIDVMLLTGARCDEVVRMRPVDIEYGDVWTYRPESHKTKHRGKDRLVHIGPKAQAVIAPFLAGRGTHDNLFSPREAEDHRRANQHAERQTPLSCGNKPGTNRKSEPARPPRSRYDTATVRRAVTRACDKADVSRWTPHQLRHTASTEIRKAAGIEAASIVLGHASATLTDGVYAERDTAKAREVIGRVG